MDGFKVTLTGTVVLRGLDASDLSIDSERLAEGNLSDELDVSYVSIESAVVDVEAFITLRDYEVAIENIDDFDAEDALAEYVHHWDNSVKGAEFEVTDGPTGFDEVEAAVGRETAIEVYATLARNGYDVI